MNTENTTLEPFITMESREQWDNGLKALKGGGMVEMSEEAYDHFMNCVPPLDFCGVSFICSEAYDYNEEGKNIYLCAINKGGKFFAQYGTLSQYRKRELFK